MFIVTGGAGFIGSAFIAKLNSEGIDDIIVVDELGSTDKWKNIRGKRISDFIHKDYFLELMDADVLPSDVSTIVHLGACSSTTERDADYLMQNNVKYSQSVAEYCTRHELRLIYASSAATYGDGALGYSDTEPIQPLLPLNAYGYSKQLFDLWMERREFSKAVGLKFFNVFGPNEYHKADMTSMVYRAGNQIKTTGQVKLFKSYHPDYSDGGQKRDFVYVKDCCDVMWWLVEKPEVCGIYNLGSGTARTWNDLASAVFGALGLKTNIQYIEMPEGLRSQYQYFTQAEMTKLQAVACPVSFSSLEDSIDDYVKQHLELSNQYW